MDFATVTALLMSTALLGVLHSQQIKGQLIITLDEPDESPIDNVPVQISDSTANVSRRINLVPGRTFHLHCQASAGGSSRGSLDAVWYSGDTEVVVSSSGDPNRPQIYTYLDGNRQTLVFTSFTEGSVGVYRCQERGTGNTEAAAVVIGASNPTVITSSQTQVLRFGQQEDNSRPSLVALISGTPYPSLSNITWQFNNQNLPDGVVVNRNELLLPGYIRPEVEGMYTCHVTTSTGTDSADIHVSLIYQPSVSLSPSGFHSVREDSSVTLTCEDSVGVPPANFTWTHNGSSLISGDHISIVGDRTSAPYRSLLTLNQFQPSNSGIYKCMASNDAGSSHQTVTISIQQPSPPAPPTSIQVTTVSACSIHIEWVWPQITTDDNMVPPDYVVFEVNLIGESHWTEIGTADITQTSLVARIPSNGLNTNFRLRSRCVSNSRGVGDYYTSTDTFIAYAEAALRRMLSLSTQVLSSSTIQILWTLQEQDCFNFTSFTASCKSATRDGVVEARSVALDSHLTMATVAGLNPDTTYNCSVTSHLRESLTGEFAVQMITYTSQLATTFPEFGVFRLLLTGISHCEEWIKEEAAAKRDALAMAVAESIKELCQCGFTVSNIQMGGLQCSVSSQTAVVYQAEMHDTPQANLPHLLSLLREWISTEPQLFINAQLVEIDSNCSVAPVSIFGEEACGESGSQQAKMPISISIYTIIGIAVGLTTILVVSVTTVTVIIAVLVLRHRKEAKLNHSSSEAKQEAIPSARNPAAVTNIHNIIETEEYPYYEQVDLDGEPQYESLDDYDRLPRSCADRIPQHSQADCPVYEPTVAGNS